MLSRTRTANRVSLQTKLEAVASAGAALYEAAERGEPMGLREVQQAAELNQQYIDILAEMESAPVHIDTSVVIGMDGQKIRFQNIDGLADWLAEVID